MIVGYFFPLWNGKEIVGYFNTMSKVYDTSVTFYEVSIFKQKYGTKRKTITVPVIRAVSGTGTPVETIMVMLDVRKKSKRQIKIILENR